MTKSAPILSILAAITLLTSGALAGIQDVFATDFNGATPAQISGVTTTTSVQGLAGVGHPNNTFSGNLLLNTTGGQPAAGVSGISTVLMLSGLPSHTSINVSFLLATLNTWDGGSDHFNIKLDGLSIFSETFDLGSESDQSYVPPPNGLLTPRQWFGHFQDYGFNAASTNFGDGAYDLSLDPRFQNIPHTSSNLLLQFYADGAGWSGGDDESWGIDNLKVSVNTPAPLPEPLFGVLCVAGAMFLLKHRW